MAIDIIKFDGFKDGKSWIAYKYPGEEFLLGTQLIVNPSQEAVFIKGGAIADAFKEGTHTLQTGNLPILRKLVNMPFGGKTPFTAEIFYINKASKLDMTWGTATPFQLEDPKYGIIVSIRSHGHYGLRVVDSRLFVGELIGSAPTSALFTYSFINSYFNGILVSHIKSVISKFMIEKKISFLDVTAYMTELSRTCTEEVCKEFERYGIEITNLTIETINPPESDYENLKKMKEKYALGEHIYVQERKLDMMDKYIDNAGVNGSAASMGLEFGVGMNMAKNVLDTFGNMMAPAQQPVQPAAPQPMAQPEMQQPAQPVQPMQPIQTANGVPCPACGSVVAVGQKFCGECGAKMEKKCPSCGQTWGPAQKFCGECGAKL